MVVGFEACGSWEAVSVSSRTVYAAILRACLKTKMQPPTSGMVLRTPGHIVPAWVGVASADNAGLAGRLRGASDCTTRLKNNHRGLRKLRSAAALQMARSSPADGAEPLRKSLSGGTFDKQAVRGQMSESSPRDAYTTCCMNDCCNLWCQSKWEVLVLGGIGVPGLAFPQKSNTARAADHYSLRFVRYTQSSASLDVGVHARWTKFSVRAGAADAGGCALSGTFVNPIITIWCRRRKAEVWCVQPFPQARTVSSKIPRV